MTVTARKAVLREASNTSIFESRRARGVICYGSFTKL